MEKADWELLPQQARDLIKKCNDSNEWPLYVCGETGRGKTFFMASAYMRFRYDSEIHNAKWIDFQPWAKRVMKSRQADDDLFEGRELERIKTVGLLCIDDCGVRVDSEAQSALLLEVLNLRQGKATIITGNHEPSTLHHVFDSRIASRLLSGIVVKMSGADRRMQGTRVVEIKG